MSPTFYEEVARVGRVHEDAARKLLPWNFGFTGVLLRRRLVFLRYIPRTIRHNLKNKRSRRHIISRGILMQKLENQSSPIDVHTNQRRQAAHLITT